MKTMGVWMRCGLAAWILFFVAGCGSRAPTPLTPSALPVALKMRDAIDAMNTSNVAGCLAAAERERAAGTITADDIETLRNASNMATQNQWNDAKKLLSDRMGSVK